MKKVADYKLNEAHSARRTAKQLEEDFAKDTNIVKSVIIEWILLMIV
jgi:hypothetical protein